jgi:hypothetical protein
MSWPILSERRKSRPDKKTQMASEGADGSTKPEQNVPTVDGSTSTLSIDSDERCAELLAMLTSMIDQSDAATKEEDSRTVKRCRWFAEMADEEEETAFWPGELVQLKLLGSRYTDYAPLFKLCAEYLTEIVDWETTEIAPEFIEDLGRLQSLLNTQGVA